MVRGEQQRVRRSQVPECLSFEKTQETVKPLEGRRDSSGPKSNG